jgi:hypothetical protein
MLRGEVEGAVREKFASSGRCAVEEGLVAGHAWGELDTPLVREIGGRLTGWWRRIAG